MRRSILTGGLLLTLLLAPSVGCNDPRGGFPVGGLIVEEKTESPAAADAGEQREAAADNPHVDGGGRESRRPLWSDDRQSEARDPLPGRSESWGNDRHMPSDSMPSRTESWGNDRQMPSDSMPSRTESWGNDRSMPSDSMPSQSDSWGGERRMPSDDW